MKTAQRRELAQQMGKSTGAYELVLSPLLLAVIGYLIDRWLGTVPVLTVIFAVVGVVGAVVKLYYGYKYDMERHESEGSWAKKS